MSLPTPNTVEKLQNSLQAKAKTELVYCFRHDADGASAAVDILFYGVPRRVQLQKKSMFSRKVAEADVKAM